jgi:dTDP-4-amino-4,6-dideoxygalactose transaminase
LFHTGEGGAIFCQDEALRHQIFYSHNFGHKGPLDFYGLGINGKISELQAAMGLAVFPYMQHILEERKKVVDYYDAHLDFSRLQKLKIRENTDWNNSYYPVIFETESELLKVQEILNEHNIFPRRYFYPSLNSIDYSNGKVMPISDEVSIKILCLPLFNKLSIHSLEMVIKRINTY